MFFLLLALFSVSFLVAFFTVPIIISYCTSKKIGGNDVNKSNRPFVPGLGGIAIVLALFVSLVFLYLFSSSQSMQKYFGVFLDSGASSVMLALIAVLVIAFLIGIVDDFFSIPHKIKLILPILISIPIILVKTSPAVLSIPLLGPLTFIPSSVYLFILIPIGVMAVTNITNTFAGFNGLEAGLSSVVIFFLMLFLFANSNFSLAMVCVSLIAALLAFLFYNWYPAKIFIDDVGTLTIGAMIAAIVIIGGLEFIGAILLIPYIIDFLFFKIPNRLPSTNWWPKVKGDKLYFSGKAVHFGQWVVKTIGGKNGITEKNLVLFFIFFEILIGIFIFFLYTLA